MAENSKIEWTDHTFNPWRGCTKVSPGCAHCYAETLAKRNPKTLGEWGPGKPRVLASESMWKQPIKWDREAALAQENWDRAVDARAGDSGPRPRRPRVFCASLADWLDDEVPAAWRFRLIQLIFSTPNLNWLLLTKRPQNWAPLLKAAADQCTIDPLDITDRIFAWITGSRVPHNVWMGTTVENQAEAKKRIPALLKIPAKVRFLSCEPLLGAVNISEIKDSRGYHYMPLVGAHQPEPTIHWVIAGGESGPGARPMHPDWARSLRDQCTAANVPFLFKQWGEWLPIGPAYEDNDDNTGDPERQILLENTGAVAVHEGEWSSACYQPDPRLNPWLLERVGKAAAGRLLDGREWNEFPVL